MSENDSVINLWHCVYVVIFCNDELIFPISPNYLFITVLEFRIFLNEGSFSRRILCEGLNLMDWIEKIRWENM